MPSRAAGQDKAHIVSATEGSETGLELPTVVSSCPRDASNLTGALDGGEQRGLLEWQLWEDGHHFTHGSGEWLQVATAAPQDMRYQHLLSLCSMQLGDAAFKEF